MIRNFYFLNFVFKTREGITKTKCQCNGFSKIRHHHIQPEKQKVCLNKSWTLVSSPFMKMLNDHLILLIYLPQISFIRVWEYLKDKIYWNSRLHILDQVKEDIGREIWSDDKHDNAYVSSTVIGQCRVYGDHVI